MKCVNISLFYNVKQGTPTPDPIAQSVSSPTADAGGASSILVRSHTFIETNREILSTVNFSFRCLSLTSEHMCTQYWLAYMYLEKVWLGEIYN